MKLFNPHKKKQQQQLKKKCEVGIAIISRVQKMKVRLELSNLPEVI